ncbi:hypothetical protein CLV91_3300, partial [Maribacter vaceletii]
MKKFLLPMLLFISGIAFSQQTVLLEDQCNCEVLSGTDVTAPGVGTPTGADIGDIYVNTDTGTIYFWDGDTWELTSTDSQQLQNFSFDSATNLLSLAIENGNTVSVDLEDLADQNAAEVNLNNPIDVDNDGNNEATVEEAIADLAANNALDLDIDPTNELTTSGVGVPVGAPANDNPGVTYLDTATNELYVYDGTNWAMVTDNQEGTEVDLTNPIDVDNDGNNEATVEEAIADLAANNALDLDIDPTNELTTSGVGVPVGAPANDNPGVTYLDTATNELYVYDGTNWTMVTDNQNASEVTVTPAGNITSTDVQAALEELDGIITSSELTTTVIEGTGIDVSSSVTGTNTEYTVTVDPTDIVGDGSLSSPDGTITLTGTPSNSVLENVGFDVADNAITTDKIALGAVESSDIAADAVDASTINSDVAGSGLTQNVTTGALEVDEAAIADGNITSVNTIDVTGGDDSVFKDVIIDVSDNAITNAKLADNAVQTENIVNGTILTEDISSGGNDQVLVTDATGVVEWIDKSTLVPATTVSNTSSGNTLSTTVDGVTGADVNIINSNDLSLDTNNDLISTVNGEASTALDLTPAIQANQTTTTVVEGTGIDVTSSVTGTNTEYTVTVDPTDIVGDGSITSSDLDVLGGTNSTLNNVSLTIANDAVDAATINSDVAGSGLTQNVTTGALEVDEAAIADGNITSVNTIDVTGGDDSVFKDVILDVSDDAITTDKIAPGAVESSDIAADAVNAATINGDVAGSGLTQNVTTGALEVDEAEIADGNITSVNTIDVTGGDDSVFKDVILDVSDNAITNAKMADNAINTAELVDAAVTLEKLADGTADGQVMQWDDATSSWVLIDLGSVTVTENDGVIGNEVVGATNGTLTRSGDGSQAVPYTLAVSTDGITNAELADNAVGLENIASGSNSGDLIQWNGTDWEFVTPSSLIPATTVSNTSSVNTLTTTVDGVTGVGVDIINSNDLSLDTNNDLISTINGEASTALDLTPAIQANQTTTTVVEGTGIDVTSSVTGNNTEYTVTVDPTDIVGDGSITSSDLDVLGGTNSTLNNVSLTIANDAVDAATINSDVAGSGLTQNVTTGALEVDEAAIADGNITSVNTIDVTGGDDSVFKDVIIDVLDNAITNAKLADNAVQTENIVNGSILTEDVSSGGSDKVLVTDATGVVEWIDKSTLVPATTVSNTSSGNTLSTTVDGVTGADVNIINSNTLTLNGSDELVSTVNGVNSNAIDLSPYVNNDTNELQDLELTGDNLTLTNDPTATAIDLSDYRETVVGTNDISVTDDGSGNYTVDYTDGDKDSTNELTLTDTGAPTGTPATGTTYVDTDTGQLYV